MKDESIQNPNELPNHNDKLLEHILVSSDENQKLSHKQREVQIDQHQKHKEEDHAADRVKIELHGKTNEGIEELKKITKEGHNKVAEALKEIGNKSNGEATGAKDIISQFMEMKKGEDGKTPVKGTDYFTEEEIQGIAHDIESRIRIPQDGVAGKDATVDYTKIVKEVVSQIPAPKDGEDGEDGEDSVIDYEKIVSDVIAKIPAPKEIELDTPQTLIQKLRSLPKGERLSYNDLDDLPTIFQAQRNNPGMAGTGYLREITDVAISSPTNGQALTYNTSTGKWQNSTLASGITVGSTTVNGGTTGEVLFIGSNGTVAVDSTFYFDVNSKYLDAGAAVDVGVSETKLRISDDGTFGNIISVVSGSDLPHDINIGNGENASAVHIYGTNGLIIEEGAVTFKQITTPSNPAAGYDALYFKSDNKLYSKTPAGVETQIGGVNSVSNVDGTLTVSPNTGAVVVSIANNTALPGSPTTTTQSAGDNSTKVATTAFVTTAVANAIAGVNPAVAVEAASAAKLPNSPTYNNGASGIGAFITTLTTNTALVVDGYTPVLNDRILVKNEGDSGGLGAAKNGVYLVTQIAALGLAWILTRALDYDMPSDINDTGAIPVINGTVNTNTQWVLTSRVTTVGTDALTYTQFSINPTTIATLGGNNAFTGNNTFKGLLFAYVAKTGNYTLTAADFAVDCTSGTFTITLPTAVGATGQTYIIKNSGTGVITLATTSSQTIDGFATATLVLRNTYQYVQVTSDGANWKITGGDVGT